MKTWPAIHGGWLMEGDLILSQARICPVGTSGKAPSANSKYALFIKMSGFGFDFRFGFMPDNRLLRRMPPPPATKMFGSDGPGPTG